jgi:hypothetical protein
MVDIVNAPEFLSAGAARAAVGMDADVTVEHHWRCEARNAKGDLLWVDEFDNLVTTAGKNYYLDAALKTGATSPALYVGLVDSSAHVYAAGDVMNSHAGWTENVTYSQSTRVAWTPGSISAGSVDNSGSAAVFSINGTTTIAGCFFTTGSAKSGTAGTLVGEGDLSVSRSLANGDTLTITVTASMS